MSEDSKKTVFRRVIIPEQEKKKYLVGNTPPFLGKPYELPTADFTIGREEGRNLQIPNDMVSRFHAIISYKDGKYFLIDNESANGTFLNGRQLPPKEPFLLSHGDVIKFDVFEFIFVDSARADLWDTLKPLSREGSQIVTFYSPKGGVGITSIVVNVAYYLGVVLNKKVVVSDFNLRFGDVLTYSNGKVGTSIHELIQEHEITNVTVNKYLHQGLGYKYLPAPNKTEYAELIKADHVRKILWSMEADNEFVLVDLKNEIDDISLTAWEISNVIYLVGKPEISHLLAIKKVLEIMNQLKYPDSKVKVIINMIGRNGTASIDQIKPIIKKDFISVPYSPDDAVLTSNGAILLLKDRPNSEISNAYKNIANNICGVKEAVPEGGIFSKLKALLGF